jgi:hypothetical protein
MSELLVEVVMLFAFGLCMKHKDWETKAAL